MEVQTMHSLLQPLVTLFLFYLFVSMCSYKITGEVQTKAVRENYISREDARYKK